MPDDNLFSTLPITSDADNGPLVVVGLPRSGSSFLSEIISQIDDWFIFDDLYLQRKAVEIGATGSLNDAHLDNLLYFLGWQIRARLRSGKYAIPRVNEDEVEPMNQAIKASLSGSGATWATLQREWRCRLAARSGCANWGYKMPQAFRNLDQLFQFYPDMKVIFLMRAPQDVLASYKYMHPGSHDGDPAQYHPIAHAFYWRLAAQAYLDALNRFNKKVKLIKFDDLVSEPVCTARTIAQFLVASEPKIIRIPRRPNTSFDKTGDRKTLNGLELYFLDRIARVMRDKLGFDAIEKKISPSDFADLFRTSLNFGKFRAKKLVLARLKWLGK